VIPVGTSVPSGDRVVFPPRAQGGAMPYSCLLRRSRRTAPLHWNRVGCCVSGPFAPPQHDVSAAGQTGEGHASGGDLGHRDDRGISRWTKRGAVVRPQHQLARQSRANMLRPGCESAINRPFK